MKYLLFILSAILLFSTANAQNNQTLSVKEGRLQQLITEDSTLPQDIIDLNNSAVEKGLKGNYQAAADDFRQIIAKAPQVYQAQYNLSRCLIAFGEYTQAIEVLNNVIKNKPDHADAQASIGEAYYEKGMYEEAILYLRRSIELNPLDAVANNNLGTAFYRTKQLGESLKYLNIAVKLEPNYAAAYNNRGVTLYLLGKAKEAIADFKKAILLKSDFAEPYNNLGVALGNSDDSHRAFLEAVRLRPDWNNALYNLALSHIERGERDLARTQLDNLSKYDSGLAEKGRTFLWQKYVVNANSFRQP